MGCPVFVQALAVFVVVTLVWLRWLMPYLRTVMQKIQGRFA